MSNLKESLNRVIDYNWEIEFMLFMDEHRDQFQFSGEESVWLEKLKEFIESKPNGTQHMLYDLVKLKLFIYEWN